MRFELTVFQICNLVRWAAPPPVHVVGLSRVNRTLVIWSQTINSTIKLPRENLVPRDRIELPSAPCKSAALPLDEQGIN